MTIRGLGVDEAESFLLDVVFPADPFARRELTVSQPVALARRPTRYRPLFPAGDEVPAGRRADGTGQETLPHPDPLPLGRERPADFSTTRLGLFF